MEKTMSKIDRLREYVIKYAESRGISVDEAWSHKIVRVFMEWLDEI